MQKHLATVIVLAAAAVGCSVPEPGIPVLSPTPLFPEYYSYMTVAEARSMWADATSIIVRFDQKVPARGRCPRFDEFTVEVSASNEQHAGSLTLTFINDRLVSTVFEPKDFDAYVLKLQQRGIAVGVGKEAHVEPATTMWITDVPLGKPPFVGWRDERLRAQIEGWIMACS